MIVAHAVTNQQPDQEHLVPMLQRVRNVLKLYRAAGARQAIAN